MFQTIVQSNGGHHQLVVVTQVSFLEAVVRRAHATERVRLVHSRSPRDQLGQRGRLLAAGDGQALDFFYIQSSRAA